MCPVYSRPTQFGTSGLTAEGVESVGASGGVLTDGQLGGFAWEPGRSRGPTGKSGMASEDQASRGAAHHSYRTAAGTVGLYASRSCMYQPGGKRARVVCIRARGTGAQRKRHICSASVRGLSASSILGEPCLRGLENPSLAPSRESRGPSSLSSPSPEPFERRAQVWSSRASRAARIRSLPPRRVHRSTLSFPPP
jgi:hypothetical protein